ncbi:hypothetical protein D3C72_1850720 [compost metagenome]
MLGKLKQLIRGIKEVETEVVDMDRLPGSSTYTATFREIGGRQRTFSQAFASYHDGRSTPKPTPGTKATLHVNRQGEDVYAGISH